jgi:hypothetical protein
MASMNEILGQVSIAYSNILGKWILYTALSGILRNQPGFDTPEQAEKWAVENGYKLNPILN